MDLSRHSDHELLESLSELVGSHRKVTAKLVAHLGEVEERRLHLKAGFSSMFDYCQRKLGFSEGEAFRRILAARLGRRFPLVHSLLASGAVHLSALELVHERLTEQNHAELLEAISGKAKREVEMVLAARFPKPDVPSRIRRLPARPTRTGEPTTVGISGATKPGVFELQAPSEPDERERRGRIEPLSATRFKVEFTASAELREKLERCLDLLGHVNPKRELGLVVERGVDLLLAELEKQRLARTTRPRRSPANDASNAKERVGARSMDDSKPVSTGAAATRRGARVPTPVRRQVFERDGERCTYVSHDGRRCEARGFLELDHVKPSALGGTGDPENLRVLCRAHNQLAAEETFGRELIARRRHFRQQKCDRSEAKNAEMEAGAPFERTRSVAVVETMNRVLLALETLGFRKEDARRAVADVEFGHASDGTEPVTTESALREALLVLTPAA